MFSLSEYVLRMCSRHGEGAYTRIPVRKYAEKVTARSMDLNFPYFGLLEGSIVTDLVLGRLGLDVFAVSLSKGARWRSSLVVDMVLPPLSSRRFKARVPGGASLAVVYSKDDGFDGLDSLDECDWWWRCS
jgi:hypothetical protein